MGGGGPEPRPWDAPRRRRDDRSFAVGVAALGAATVLLAVLGAAVLMPPGGVPERRGAATEPPRARPTRDPLARALLVSQATFFAPSPTPTPQPTPLPTSTPVPVVLCGLNATAGQACRWPEPAAPSPTPLPACGTPVPGQLCRWGVAALPTARPRP